ncbi:hypothetical protein L204_100434 [Cryptococcus depauperatus]|nr:hypothetical protein L204_02084 [Cryptococcus depauperatus CBS 7855]
MSVATQITSSNLLGSSLHQALDQLAAAAAQPDYNIHQNRDRFQERALRDVTTASNDSAMAFDPNNPVLVREEMNAQKDYFRRLKFAYLEQDAKRHFLASITGEEPQRVEPGENEERERINAEKKAVLKTAKHDIEEMRSTTIHLAGKNTEMYTKMTSQLSEAQALQKQIRDMELELARIKATYPPDNRMTANQANEILDAQIDEIQRLTDEREVTQAEADRTREDVARVAQEVQRLSRDREREEARAREVREGREAGDTRVDDACRWLTSSISFYRSLLGIRSVKAVSNEELHLEYDVPNGSVVLVITFDALTKRFSSASLRGSNLDITEAAGVAEGSNDIPGLIADVLMRLRE